MKTQSDLNLSFYEIKSFADPQTGDRIRKEAFMNHESALFIHDNRLWMEVCKENGWPVDDEVIDYGESFEGMARHVSAMSGLERIIFEDCDFVAGKVTAPHMNLKAYPHWLCPEYIAKKTGCGLKDASDLVECWVVLDPTWKMVECFISWVASKGIDKALPYFERLAMALAEVENIDVDDVTESEEPQYTGQDLYAYHPVGEYPDDDCTTWVERQPSWYQELIRKVKECNDLDQVSALGKEVYERDLNQYQAGVFWTEYNIVKRRIEDGIKLGPVSRSFIQRIAKANGNLASLGAWLYKVQQGLVKISNPPSRHEWTVIWKSYQQHKMGHDSNQLSLY
ncbi:MAG: hypothetical protein JW932_19120 [Deltaproteobacteria bacterium]|nr:hypothetical protein [Deltaproteobacteria bacterium]